ncbi:hypothetical protein [Paenibacillus taiwanensis]|uniref:hypothetical protein n=1 Tax=Paenibacillus taiwanensis TaxID=401638 RepID=UPI000491C837|nr:hypothetical protein [Paenibacillus taiwanensis]
MLKQRVLSLFLFGFILCSLPVLADANSYYYDANKRLIQVNEYGHSFKYVYNYQGGLQKVVKDANLHINTISNWKKVSGSFVVPDHAAIARIHLHTQRHTKEGKSSADFIVDDVVMSKDK